MAASGRTNPTLLTFHGSGSNETIHTVQLARVARILKLHFEFESLNGPIESAAGPGVLPFFDGCGPFYRWVPPSESSGASKLQEASATHTAMPSDVSSLIQNAVAKANARGSKVVGVIGFSQGTRVVAGLLKAAQIRRELKKEGKAEGLEWLQDLSFGLSVCTSYPPPVMPTEVLEAVKASGWDETRQKEVMEAKIDIPTLHVLGLQDEYRWAGKLLIESGYDPEIKAKDEVANGTTGLYEFNMGHHYPVQAADTQKVADWVLGTWEIFKD